MRRSLFALGALAALGVGSAAFGQAVYTPINLAPSSFNEDVVIEATATTPLKSSITATMDHGEGLGGDTWFESGLSIGKANSGLPVGAGTFTSAADANSTFLLQPYNGKNVLLLNNHSATADGPKVFNGTFTLTTPTAVGGLKFLASSGNGAGTVGVLIHYSNGAPDRYTQITVPDWFDFGTPPKNAAAIVENGRVNPTANTGAGSLDNYNATPNQNPRIYEIPFNDLGNATNPISSIDFSFLNAAGNTNTAIFGISGSPTPEPGTLSLIALGGFGLIRRRRA